MIEQMHEVQAKKQDDRRRQILGRRHDRPGIMAVERADEQIELGLNFVHLFDHHELPPVLWKSAIDLAIATGSTLYSPLAMAARSDAIRA